MAKRISEMNMVFDYDKMLVLELAERNFKETQQKNLEEFEQHIENIGSYGKMNFEYTKGVVIPVYIESGDTTLPYTCVKKLYEFHKDYDVYDKYIRETMFTYFNNHKDGIMDTFNSTFALKEITYDIDSTSIGDIIDVVYIIMKEDGYMGIGISSYWSDSFYEIPIMENNIRIPLSNGIRNIKTSNGGYESISIDEVTTFRDLEERPDLGMIITHGTVRAFFRKNNVQFPVWLLRTYEISELQEDRFREFQKNYSYYSNLISESLTKYFKVKYRNIVNDSPDMSAYDRNSISKKQIMNMCNLSRIEISNDGTTYIIVSTDWGEDITVQIWDKDTRLTNYFALPIIGNKYGRI